MTLIPALAVGVLFGCGAFLLLKPDLFRIVAGIVLVAHAANIALISSGLERGQSPIHPLAKGPVSDPLVQALTITALVIGFAVTALLLCLAYGIYVSSKTVDLDDLSHAEARDERELEREEVSV